MFPAKEGVGAKSPLVVKKHCYGGEQTCRGMSTVPGVCNGLGSWEEEGPGPGSCSAEDGVGMGVGGWLFLSQTFLRIRRDFCAIANEKQL